MDKVTKIFTFDIKEINEEDHSFWAIASTETPDRSNDVIEAAGWELENFKANPVVPWAHDYYSPPVGKAVDIKIEGGKLFFKVQFAVEEYEFAATIFKLYKGGYLKAFSVGFIPKAHEAIRSEPDDDGYQRLLGFRFKRQELLEISAVPVPANPEALALAAKAGIDVEPVQKWLTDAVNMALCKGFAGEEDKGAEEAETPPETPVTEEKAGAVLSTANKKALSDAVALIQGVVDSATPEDGKSVEPPVPDAPETPEPTEQERDIARYDEIMSKDMDMTAEEFAEAEAIFEKHQAIIQAR